MELQQKNQHLTDENKRQEVFLRASSHQLKTPIAAALLLVEGMMDEVGKYKDTKTYLPQVKLQLISMKNIVEDILYLNHCSGDLRIEEIPLLCLVHECLRLFSVEITDRGLYIHVTERESIVKADTEILRKIIDNLLSNAIHYTSCNNIIEIVTSDSALIIRNHGAHIEDTLLPHIFEPFVSSDTRKKGHGLGLYVAAYYAELLGCSIDVHNLTDCVQTRLTFHSPVQLIIP